MYWNIKLFIVQAFFFSCIQTKMVYVILHTHLLYRYNVQIVYSRYNFSKYTNLSNPFYFIFCILFFHRKKSLAISPINLFYHDNCFIIFISDGRVISTFESISNSFFTSASQFTSNISSNDILLIRSKFMINYSFETLKLTREQDK